MPRTPLLGSLLLLMSLSLGCTYCGGEAAPVSAAATAQKLEAASPCGSEGFPNSAGACVPNAWFCGPRYYNAGSGDGCDCDCGAPDPDCAASDAKKWCYNGGRPRAAGTCEECKLPRALLN